MGDMEDFLRCLDIKKQSLYRSLPEEKKIIIQSMPTNKMRKRALVMVGHEHHHTNARNKWVNGLNHMRLQANNPNHFFDMIFNLDRHAIDDMIDMYLNFEAGEYDSEKNTDPAVYAAIEQGVRTLKARRYHEMDYDGLMNYFEEHPEKNPRNKAKNKRAEVSSETKKEMGAKKYKEKDKQQEDRQEELEKEIELENNEHSVLLKNMGENLRTWRQSKNMTQAELALTCDISEKTVKKIESGHPSSTATLLRLFDFFGLSGQVLQATAPSGVSLKREDIKRVRHPRKLS